MTRQLLSLFIAGMSLTAVSPVYAQAPAPASGTIVYEETMKMGIEKNEENAQFFDMLPKEQKMSRKLYFTSTESLYENDKAAENKDMEHAEGNTRMVIRMDAPDEKYYQDIAAQIMLIQRDFMGRKFLVEDKITPGKWKLTGNQATILTYPCQEAVMQDSDIKMTAWFTPALPVSTGPSNAAGLPGLILKLDVNEGQHVINATAIDLGPVALGKIKKPKDGRKMSRAEFRAMVEEKTKEMGGDGNNVIIKIRH